MTTEVFEGDKRLNFTATTADAGSAQGGQLLGVLVASSSSGTLKVEDGIGTICDTMSVSAGVFYPMPCRYTGLMTLTVGGTLNATLFYK